MDINRLFGKPKTYNIAGAELTLKPLELEDLDIIMELSEPEKRGQAMKKIIITTLKKSYPELKDDEISKVSMAHFEALSKAIMNVNNLPEG